MTPSPKQLKKFWFYVDKREPTECWEWQGACTRSGYGVITMTLPEQEPKQFYAHRLAYFLCNGNIPEGFQVLHECDNRKCVNPAHLSIGTAKQNSEDMALRLRNRTPKNTKFKQLSPEQLEEIKTSTESVHALARRFQVAVEPIRQFRKGVATL